MNESIDGKIINWWHTREDTFDKVDPEVALRDTRVIGELTAFFANCGKLPADMSGFVDFMECRLRAIEERLGGDFDLSPVWPALGRLREAVMDLEASMEGQEHTDDAIMETAGDLAESFEMVDDKTYKFKLREGVKFHNGEELKASDVKFSLERAKIMPKAMSNASAIDHVSVEGDYDLTIHLSRPYPSLLYVLNDTSMKILSEKAVTEAGETYGEEPIGTGPFMFKEWGPNDHWTLVRFDDYFDGPATATSITNRIIPEGSARTIALETGEIDVILTVDPVDAANVEANDELVLESWPSASVEFMAFNTTKKGLDDVRVRQAITYAMNRQEFVDTIVEGRGEVASSFIAKTLPGWNEEVQPYPQDLEKAKELLAEAGYGDGLDLKMYVSGDVRNRTAQVVQAQLAQIGVNVDINVYEWGTFQDAINAGEHELLILGWTNTTCDPEYSVTPLFHSKNCGMNGNRAYLRDEKVDQMIDAASMETDRETRLQTYRDLQVRLNELCPWVPLYYKSNMVGRRADLKGFQFNKNTAPHHSFLNLIPSTAIISSKSTTQGGIHHVRRDSHRRASDRFCSQGYGCGRVSHHEGKSRRGAGKFPGGSK